MFLKVNLLKENTQDEQTGLVDASDLSLNPICLEVKLVQPCSSNTLCTLYIGEHGCKHNTNVIEGCFHTPDVVLQVLFAV